MVNSPLFDLLPDPACTRTCITQVQEIQYPRRARFWTREIRLPRNGISGGNISTPYVPRRYFRCRHAAASSAYLLGGYYVGVMYTAPYGTQCTNVFSAIRTAAHDFATYTSILAPIAGRRSATPIKRGTRSHIGLFVLREGIIFSFRFSEGLGKGRCRIGKKLLETKTPLKGHGLVTMVQARRRLLCSLRYRSAPALHPT